MKKILFLILAAAALKASPANAGPVAYIGLYTDAIHSVYVRYIPEPYVQYTTWVWILPGDNGMMCAEFKLVQPSWNLCISSTPNPLNSIILGAPYADDGVTFCFDACQSGWVWLYQLGQLPTLANIIDCIYIVDHPEAGACQVAECTPGYPVAPLIKLNYLYLNETPGTNEDASWGAIKGICDN
ncbi:MAG: hypothetical protein MUF59_06050 [Candidatus Krumholzibacteria bacterium]|jgi:hypothetical protein|nr:hypothetical protein [Candidatus Krumholzibacteria bacterium]